MDLKEIKKLIALMNENGLVELEVSEDGRRCVLKKAPPPGVQQHVVTADAGNHVALPAPPIGKVPIATPALMEGARTFNSPIVGTFYRAASPEAEPFVKAGDRINPDTVLCLIEAMKVFNEIKAEMSGTIVDVLVENQEAVEFNQPLFLIKP